MSIREEKKREEKKFFGRFCGLIKCSRTFEFKGPTEWQLVGGVLTNRTFYNIKNSSILVTRSPSIWLLVDNRKRKNVSHSFGKKNDNKLRLSHAGGSVHSWVSSSSLWVRSASRIKRNHIAVLTQCLLDTPVPRVSDDRTIKTELGRI